MKIEYLHASKFGNGAVVAAEFGKPMAAKGDSVNVHHIREVRPTELAPADLYLSSSPASTFPLHDLRHFMATQMLAHGIVTVSQRLGHGRASTTLNVYGHCVPGPTATPPSSSVPS